MASEGCTLRANSSDATPEPEGGCDTLATSGCAGNDVSAEEAEKVMSMARAEMGGEMTREERINYLRERGVQIELPSGGENSKLVEEARASMLHKLQSDSADSEVIFSYVFLPADSSRPATELKAVVGVGDVLPELLASAFAGDTVSDDTLLETARTHGQSVGIAALRQALSKGGAEAFRLAAPSEVDGESVNVYLDDCAALKAKPLNSRASVLAQACGFDESCTFAGDVFLGRLKWTGDCVTNVSFFLGELEPNSVWQQRAPIENLRFQKNTRPELHAEAQKDARFNDFASGVGDGYAWKDGEEDLDITVYLDSSVRVPKASVRVNFARQTVEMVAPKRCVWKLYSRIDPEGCSWSFCAEGIQLSLQKLVEERWPRLCSVDGISPS